MRKIVYYILELCDFWNTGFTR